LGDLEVEGR